MRLRDAGLRTAVAVALELAAEQGLTPPPECARGRGTGRTGGDADWRVTVSADRPRVGPAWWAAPRS